MAKPDLGTKRLCANCGAKFYDLKRPRSCRPKCGTSFELCRVTTRPRRPMQRAPLPRAETGRSRTTEPQEAELISLEEADAEAQGKKVPAAPKVQKQTEDGETEEAIEDDDEDTFIEPEEEEDTDVSEIIGGDIENEEET